MQIQETVFEKFADSFAKSEFPDRLGFQPSQQSVSGKFATRGVRSLLAAVLLVTLSVGMSIARGADNADLLPFGPQVYLFNPQMPLDQIQKAVNRIAAAQSDNEFGADRYAIL